MYCSAKTIDSLHFFAYPYSRRKLYANRKKAIISDVMMLESVMRFLADNNGNSLSTKKISDTVTSQGRKINVRTVDAYITAFMESYIVYQAKRYDVKGKRYLFGINSSRL